MLVKDIMSTDIVSLNSEDSIMRAAQIMKQFDVGSVPVCNQEKLVGIVTDRDITLNSVATGANVNQQKISDVMTSNPTTGRPDMDIHDAAKIMSDQQIRRLPIIENNNLVGIVSLGDISIDPHLQDNAEYALKNISKPGTNNHTW
jgi:CBS domain-containing protein